MRTQEALRTLELLGTEQNRKIYFRHGVTSSQFGVSFTKLKKLAKDIGRDSEMAIMLWSSGNHDARILACLVMDPISITEDLANRWVQDLDDYVLTDAFSNMLSQTPFVVQIAEKWIDRPGEWISAAGWNLVSHIAMKNMELSNAYFEKHIQTIEDTIHQSLNRTRYSMNNALIAIGIRNPILENKAKAAAKRIGKVYVDHGETSCKTPDAIAYINKTIAHRAKKAKA